MKNIIIFIWEWKSEISFFQTFLLKSYSITAEYIKSGIMYEINWNFVIFAHPIVWNEDHLWWDHTFKSAKTYSDINTKIFSHRFCLNKKEHYVYKYLFLTDLDKPNSKDKLDSAEQLIREYCSAYIGEIIPVFAIKEIENWFLAWLWDEFIKNYPRINTVELWKIHSMPNIDKLDNAKETLRNQILSETSIWSAQWFIWREFWNYIDIEQAMNLSDSFKEFIKRINECFTH